MAVHGLAHVGTEGHLVPVGAAEHEAEVVLAEALVAVELDHGARTETGLRDRLLDQPQAPVLVDEVLREGAELGEVERFERAEVVGRGPGLWRSVVHAPARCTREAIYEVGA